MPKGLDKKALQFQQGDIHDQVRGR